jgi:hypothetical protein
MENFRIEIKKDNKIIFENDNTEFKNLYILLTEYIPHAELFPNAIIEDVERSGGAACYCGSIGIGYKIAKNSSDNKLTNYYFN